MENNVLQADSLVEEVRSHSLATVDTASVHVPVRFAAPEDADSLADALIAGQLSPRTRRAYASDLADLLSCLEAWNLTLRDVNRDHLHAWRSWLAGEDVPGPDNQAQEVRARNHQPQGKRVQAVL